MPALSKWMRRKHSKTIAERSYRPIRERGRNHPDERGGTLKSVAKKGNPLEKGRGGLSPGRNNPSRLGNSGSKAPGKETGHTDICG
jgi:hypothetical protein